MNVLSLANMKVLWYPVSAKVSSFPLSYTGTGGSVGGGGVNVGFIVEVIVVETSGDVIWWANVSKINLSF